MKNRYVAVTMIVAGVFTCDASRAAEATTPDSKPPAGEAAPASHPAKRALQKGMTADEIVALIGKPDKIEPMKTAEGKAEAWTYRRKIDTMVTQVPTHTIDITAFNGMPSAGSLSGTVQTPTLAYSMETTTTYQVTSLLIYDGKLVVAKQWREREKNLNR